MGKNSASMIKRIAGNIASGMYANHRYTAGFSFSDPDEAIPKRAVKAALEIDRIVDEELEEAAPTPSEHPVKAATKPDPDVNERRRREFLKDGR